MTGASASRMASSEVVRLEDEVAGTAVGTEEGGKRLLEQAKAEKSKEG